jgi:hypothetical protein
MLNRNTPTIAASIKRFMLAGWTFFISGSFFIARGNNTIAATKNLRLFVRKRGMVVVSTLVTTKVLPTMIMANTSSTEPVLFVFSTGLL